MVSWRPEEALRPYAKPALSELGRMDAVTRKSGPITDIDTQQSGSNLNPLQQFLCLISGGAVRLLFAGRAQQRPNPTGLWVVQRLPDRINPPSGW